MPLVLHTPSGDVDIRPARMDDMPAFRVLRLQALRDHPEALDEHPHLQRWRAAMALRPSMSL